MKIKMIAIEFETITFLYISSFQFAGFNHSNISRLRLKSDFLYIISRAPITVAKNKRSIRNKNKIVKLVICKFTELEYELSKKVTR